MTFFTNFRLEIRDIHFTLQCIFCALEYLRKLVNLNLKGIILSKSEEVTVSNKKTGTFTAYKKNVKKIKFNSKISFN